MSKSDWYWFTGILMVIMSVLTPVNAPHPIVGFVAGGFGLLCMLISQFAGKHPDIRIQITVVQDEDKNPTPFGIHTSEDK